MHDSESTKHKQVSIYNPMFKQYIEVDEGLVELLQLAWDLGMGTEYSCQDKGDGGHGGITEIHFLTVGQLERFINIILQFVPKIIDFENTSTYQRIIRHGCLPCWEVSPQINYFDELENVREIYLSASLLFPATDIPEVVTALKKADLYTVDDGGPKQ